MKYKKVLVIGSGPIVIGQAAEFDYAGTQACKSLREEGIVTILVNSNPATIMTDEGIADVVYIEPLTVDVITRIIQSEKPDGILPTLGGQTGLNLAVELAAAGVLDRFGVALLGTPIGAIKQAEDRELFRSMLIEIGEPVLPSTIVGSLEEAEESVSALGLPLVIRPAYTLGGTGGGIATTASELREIVAGGLDASPISQVLLERSLVGWKEIEYEVMRDGADNCITICNMENIDPMGVHTGDSIVVAPSQTLSDKEYQSLRSASLNIIRSLGIEGGCNVQFALAPGEIVSPELPYSGNDPGDYFVIEVNPRVSRSSALASKATGYPIARVAAKIAVGRRLDEIPNAVTRQTVAAFEPALDYCVVKIPRWPFDKFPGGDRGLGTQMKATGEVMAIDRSFEAAFQKAVRSLEVPGRSALWENPQWAPDDTDPLKNIPLHPHDERLWALLAALRQGVSPDDLSRITSIDPWFTRALDKMVSMEIVLSSESLTPQIVWRAKRMGFPDEAIAQLSGKTYENIRKQRREWGISPVYKMVDTCAAEFEAETPYFYSTYEQENEAAPLARNKVIVVGSGPIRIGQGIEFDYCSVHAAKTLKERGVFGVLINSNPETVSTDFDTSDRLYFEPLDDESVRDIIENESFVDDHGSHITPETVVQFGGQTAINLSQSLSSNDLPILGSSAQAINQASDRQLFEEFLRDVGIPNPPGSTVSNLDQALNVAQSVGYPVLVRPSYVLGGRAMEIVHGPDDLAVFMDEALAAGGGRRVLIDKYFEGKEVEVDAICDGETVLIPGIMEHVERAGVHSGDSMAIYPPLTLSDGEISTIVDYTIRIGMLLNVRGLMNIQYVVLGGDSQQGPIRQNDPSSADSSTVYVLEVNPRSSRTVPFISKVTGVPLVHLAVNSMLGFSLKQQGYSGGLWKTQKLVGIKAPVFSMSKLSGVDTHLGPEMKSTGEVMGIDYTFGPAVGKALLAAGLMLPSRGSILVSLSDKSKAESVPMLRKLAESNYKLYATEGTAVMLGRLGLPVKAVLHRLGAGHPNVVDVIREGVVDAVVNTITGDHGAIKDGFEIRRAAAEKRIPCFTSLDTAGAAVDNLAAGKNTFSVKPFPTYRSARNRDL